MSKHFRPWNIDQTLLLPPNVRDFVPKDHQIVSALLRVPAEWKFIGYFCLGYPQFEDTYPSCSK
jgi:hypothetical protein